VLQIEADLFSARFAEACQTSLAAVLQLHIDCYCSGVIKTPEYPDLIGQHLEVWEKLTLKHNMPPVQRAVLLDGIEFGSKLGFEVEPGSVDLGFDTWEDTGAFISAAGAILKAIQAGILNTRPDVVTRINQFFVIDKKPDPDARHVKLYREIFHASSSKSDDPDLRVLLSFPFSCTRIHQPLH
jgi:hypothetical protein